MKLAGLRYEWGDTLPSDRKYETAVKQEESENMFWAGVHKEILQIKSAPLEVKAKSKEWLIDHGYWTGCNSA